MRVEQLVFVGPGRLGLALGYALVQADAVRSLVYHGRRPDPPSHPLFIQGLAEYRQGIERPAGGTTALFLTVPDRVLPEICIALAARGPAPAGCPALHTSGVQGAEPLEPLNRAGYRVGTLHPFQAVANPITGAERLMGAGFAISGEREALAAARRIVAILGGKGMEVPTHRRPLYHAAGVLASNYVVVLLAEATRLLQEAGARADEAEAAVLSLARGTVENVAELGLVSALTGPIVRGDVETVGLHLRSLDEADASFYAVLGRRTLDRVRETLSPEVVGELDELFGRYA
jgi:predicted short-subunit dehydrogenase-like oxidoreductase (DUF2520 family)